ncbi:peptidoglycan-binding protein [Mastigocladopsis repens]|uniref:peptidoglycan-binding protein n=1 Tax=Mastigocladopsis repens TaxID=221287 RepID=UPI0002E8D87D|nr:peptidoglycan-binding protein [Mastigocladopsis repens]
MRLRYSSIVFIACLACLGFDQRPASTLTPDPVFRNLELAQAGSKDTTNQSILRLGSTGAEVKSLQTLLKKLGYYDGEIDGRFGIDTRLAVTQFQQAKGLTVDGIFGTTTRQNLQTTINKKLQTSSLAISSTPENTTNKEPQRGILWWSLVGIGVLGGVGALLYVVKWLDQGKKVAKYPESYSQVNTSLVPPTMEEFHTGKDVHSHGAGVISPQETTVSPSTQLLPMETTSRLAKVNIIDQLIEDLHSPDPTQRRKAIWDLGQKGDSRAIQPLVDLMMDADSQQRSLILAAISEIGTRTLKPMNRALAVSLQDESPQVRQNAIRDLTRVYDMMAQTSQMLSHAVQDPDADVQASAKYALSQMNRIRALPGDATTGEKDADTEEENKESENY